MTRSIMVEPKLQPTLADELRCLAALFQKCEPLGQAADALEAISAENAKLREALEQIAGEPRSIAALRRIAAAALKEPRA